MKNKKQNKAQDFIKINVSLNISKEDISSLLDSALEGGSNYWYMIKGQTDGYYLSVYNSYGDYIMSGKSVLINDEVGDETLKQPVKLNLSLIKKGLKLFAESKEYAHHWRDFVSGDADQTTADVFLQFCIFGEQIYG